MTRGIEEQLAYLGARPPSCLAGLGCQAAPLPDEPFDGHGEPLNTFYALACACGSRDLSAHAHEGEVEIEPPITVTCAACGRTQVVFDPRRHGYDGALALAGDYPIGEGPPVELEATDLGYPGPYQLLARFEYPSDTLEGDEAFAAWKGRESDLFSWFTLCAADGDDGTLAVLFDWECA